MLINSELEKLFKLILFCHFHMMMNLEAGLSKICSEMLNSLEILKNSQIFYWIFVKVPKTNNKKILVDNNSLSCNFNKL